MKRPSLKSELVAVARSAFWTLVSDGEIDDCAGDDTSNARHAALCEVVREARCKVNLKPYAPKKLQTCFCTWQMGHTSVEFRCAACNAAFCARCIAFHVTNYARNGRDIPCLNHACAVTWLWQAEPKTKRGAP